MRGAEVGDVCLVLNADTVNSSYASVGDKQSLNMAWDVYSGADGDSGGAGLTLEDLAVFSFAALVSQGG